jgi:hypothetical protein
MLCYFSDCFSVQGLRYTAGLVKRKNIIADFDADVVALMKKAGGIMLAITNVSELCMVGHLNYLHIHYILLSQFVNRLFSIIFFLLVVGIKQ